MENPNYKNENIERNNLNNMWKNQFLKVKNSLLELQKDLIELKDRELKDRVVKIKKETEEVFSKLVIVFIDDMDKFWEKYMKKIRPIKDTWYDSLINYISEPIRNSLVGFKHIFVSRFNTPKQIVFGRGKKLSKPKTQNKINNIRNPFKLKKKKKR